MEDLRYITEERVKAITQQKNYENEVVRKVIDRIKPFINESLIGTKLRAVSKNTFAASFKGNTHENFEEFRYSMYFDGLGYLYLRINTNKYGYNREITLLKTDDKGVVTKVWDINEIGKESYNEFHQIDLVNKIADLQQQINDLRKGLIYEIYS